MREYVLITGGTSGIGYELARCFANNGYGIVIVASNEKNLAIAKDKITSEFDVPVVVYMQDLSELGSASILYQRVKSDGISINILVNNAGFGLIGSSEQMNMKKDQNMMTLNMISLVDLCKEFLKDRYVIGSGKILNVASTGAFQPGPYTSTYYASKAFVLSYSRAIRYEAKKKGIQVCTLCPGATKTDFFNKAGTKTPMSAMSAQLVAQYAYRRFMKNKEISVPGVMNRVIRLIPKKIKMYAVAAMKNHPE